MELKYFATGNKNKLREVNEILGMDLEQIDLELLEPQGIDVAEVVEEKARDAYEKCGKPVLVEDTGLEFIAWNGLPGALIKWFMDSVDNKGILKMMAGEAERGIKAKTAVGFYDGQKCHVFVGEVEGEIPAEVRGQSGFGWDPLFIPKGYDESFAEMGSAEKNQISMRKLALEKLSNFLTS